MFPMYLVPVAIVATLLGVVGVYCRFAAHDWELPRPRQRRPEAKRRG